MNTGPTAAEIAAAVARWLADGGVGTEDFHGKVAANALNIVARELELGPASERRAIERLTEITGQSGGFTKLETALCTMIEQGQVSLTEPRLTEHLRATARDRLAIDQPRYRSLLG